MSVSYRLQLGQVWEVEGALEHPREVLAPALLRLEGEQLQLLLVPLKCLPCTQLDRLFAAECDEWELGDGPG